MFEICYFRGGLQGEVVIFFQVVDQLVSDFVVVDIGIYWCSGGCYFLLWIVVFYYQWCLLFNLCVIGGEFYFLE